MRLLTIDIETRPNLAWIFDLYERGIVSPDKLVEASQMICFAAKWAGETGEPMFYSDFHDGHNYMVGQAWQLLDEADAIITYNGDRFDEPRINRELINVGLWPPSPFKRVDLYKVVRQRFAFPSGKLDYVCQELGIGKKTPHDGFELWRRCMADDPDAWSTMREYNKHDVVLTEGLYRAMLPWIPGLPSYGAETGLDVCSACGSGNIHREGYAYTRTGRYQRWQCNTCRAWLRSTRRDMATEIVQAAA